ncbi:hypothetical protein A5784_16410 [Mycobacterium sp. 852013-50091_SCH5140682]|uniref:hypothetical protein n=1 Tax=Mycobacterium sp. 852013-50091_SCH5140682 TaxID=1834109 RepID=UPI0007EA5906|nr:hypothetical protein [Mycobacterium sp. 852013-50091_SCH5140682]OBC01989.1 hypothetical protein A5784_16410 [Mycobacterium sp. 852013-50091_SCH5140682]
MSNGGPQGEGTLSDIPWAAAFDPAVNIRALGEIQARGFRAASSIVDRFVRMSRPTAPPPAADSTETHTEATQSREQPALPDVDQVLAAWQKMLGQVVGSLRSAAAAPSDTATLDLVNSRAKGQLLLEAAEAGSVCTEVWLHNGGTDDLGSVVLRCSDLLAHDGSAIPAAGVRFTPATVPMVARCSRGVTMEIDVPDGATAGCYRGTLLADGHPDVWLPIALTVTPSAP